VWTTGTAGSGATYAALDNSGRLRLYGPDQLLVAWQSPVPGGNANVLRLEDNGGLAAHRPDGKKVWGTPSAPAEYEQFTFRFNPPVPFSPAPAAPPP
jgi:hypothetical protein